MSFNGGKTLTISLLKELSQNEVPTYVVNAALIDSEKEFSYVVSGGSEKSRL